MQRRHFLQVTSAAALSSSWIASAYGQSKTPIKVGILHSLSGTMAISRNGAEGDGADDDRRASTPRAA